MNEYIRDGREAERERIGVSSQYFVISATGS